MISCNVRMLLPVGRWETAVWAPQRWMQTEDNHCFFAYGVSITRRFSEWRSSDFVWIHAVLYDKITSLVCLPAYPFTDRHSPNVFMAEMQGGDFHALLLSGALSRRNASQNHLQEQLNRSSGEEDCSDFPQGSAPLSVNSPACVIYSSWSMSSRLRCMQLPTYSSLTSCCGSLALTEAALQALTFSTNRIWKEQQQAQLWISSQGLTIWCFCFTQGKRLF